MSHPFSPAETDAPTAGHIQVWCPREEFSTSGGPHGGSLLSQHLAGPGREQLHLSLPGSSRSSGSERWAGLSSTPLTVGKTQAGQSHPRSPLGGGVAVKTLLLAGSSLAAQREGEGVRDRQADSTVLFSFLSTDVYAVLSPPFPFALREPVCFVYN